jgi:hypothetical protein
MFEKIEYNKSAFKHKISEEDVQWAFFHYRYDGPIEIMYNEIDEHSVNVFHAMRCRSIYYPLLNT